MIDSSSKFPYTGLIESTNRDYGDYDECVKIDYKYDGGRVLGKHCLFSLGIVDPGNIPDAPVNICKINLIHNVVS